MQAAAEYRRISALSFVLIKETHLGLLLCILLCYDLQSLQSVALRTQCTKLDRLAAYLAVNS